jgi:uncharacterized protein
MKNYQLLISTALNITERQVESTLNLLNEGATIPFISRYRKEMTGGLDEVQIGNIKERYDKLCEITKRKETIINTIEEQNKLTPELKKRIEETWESSTLEDIYLPYKPKRKTKAEIARQKGLEPLAITLMMQRENNPEEKAAQFLKNGLKDINEAIKGAQDIVAEMVNEDEQARNTVRNLFGRQAVISSKVIKGKEEEAIIPRILRLSEPLKRCSSHRLLAIRRGESEGLLKVSISPDDEECVGRLERMFIRSNNACARYVAEALQDAYKRLLKPSIETETGNLSKER